MKKTKARAPRIALALAGGGPLGAIHEIGALCALEEALDGLDFTALDHYVGVSAGGFIAAGLANGLRPRELCAAFIEDGGAGGTVFDPAWLMVPAYGEFLNRAARVPALALSAAWAAIWRRAPLTQVIEKFAPAVPTGLLSNSEIHTQLERIFSQPGRSNDFRTLPRRLTLVATDLDTGEAAPFGRKGWDHVPISLAVQASCALPGLFPPVEIAGRCYVDGALKKTMHASVALDEGVDLLLCLNPLVSFQPGPSLPRIVEGGLPAVLNQTFRTMIHSRLELGMKHYARAYPDTDIVLLEPDQEDPELYLANTFSYRRRRQLAEHAYQQTRAQLAAQADRLGPKFARHGIRLRTAVLADPARRLVPAAPARRWDQALGRLHSTLDDLEQRLQAA